MQQFNPKNQDILIYVGDRLFPRNKAKVSVFDSVVQGGDAVWEGLRVYDGKIFCLDQHLRRLQASAKSMAFAAIPSADKIREAIFTTLKANHMRDKTHIRLTLTRGEKVTSGMDPRLNQSGPCLIVLAEWKDPIYPAVGIKLVTSHIRRNSPQFLDSKIHHNNLINNILAKIEANLAQADDAIMLDSNGFVSETNATNIFLCKDGVLYTPHVDSCLPGITRSVVIRIAREHNIPFVERNISITEFYNADEVFTTGTMGELTRVYEIDGRIIENTSEVRLLETIQSYFAALTAKEGVPLPF